jgi:hypothetical protein
MKLPIISKEQAERLKALGYEIPTFADKDVLPYVAEVVKWLRDVKEIYVTPNLFYTQGQPDWLYTINVKHYQPFSFRGVIYKEQMFASENCQTYEEAESAGLDAALEILEQ